MLGAAAGEDVTDDEDSPDGSMNHNHVVHRAASPSGLSPSPVPRKYFTTEEAASYCGFKSTGALRTAKLRGQVKPAGRRGGTGPLMWEIAELDRFLTGGGGEISSPSPLYKTPRRASQPRGKIEDVRDLPRPGETPVQRLVRIAHEAKGERAPDQRRSIKAIVDSARIRSQKVDTKRRLRQIVDEARRGKM